MNEVLAPLFLCAAMACEWDVTLDTPNHKSNSEDVDFDVVDAMIHAEREDATRSVNVVKWVDFEFYGEKLKEEKVYTVTH